MRNLRVNSAIRVGFGYVLLFVLGLLALALGNLRPASVRAQIANPPPFD